LSSSSSPLSPSYLSAEAQPHPVHPEALNYLYLLYSFACFVERSFRFGLPLILAFVEGGYQAIALLGFIAPLACSLFGPSLGRLLDQVNRPFGLGLMIALQGIAISGAGLVLMLVEKRGMPLLESPLFHVLLALSALERLSAMASELSIERDWVTQLAGRDNATVLSKSNAMLRRTDLTCELLGAIAFGWIYSAGGLMMSAIATTVLAVAFAPLQLLCLGKMTRLVPSIVSHGRKNGDESNSDTNNSSSSSSSSSDGGDAGSNEESLESLSDSLEAPSSSLKLKLVAAIQGPLTASLSSWALYFRQPILPSSLTFVILFFNVGMSPGGLITAFLTSWGFNGNAMAIFRGGCAVMGFTGTWVGGRLIQKYGLIGAGTRALSIQMTLLTAATITYALFIGTGRYLTAPTWAGGISAPVLCWAGLVLLSRIGMWSFDMVNAQLFQQRVDQRAIASASTAEMALCNLSELAVLGLAAYVISPAMRGVLVYSSMGAVLLANGIFWRFKKQLDA
jgi:iron-regulated transporter 1